MLGRGIACLAFSFYVAWKFSVVFLAVLPFIIACSLALIHYASRYTQNELTSYAPAAKTAQEMLNSIRTVTSLGMQNKAIESYKKNLRDLERTSKNKVRY